jgi:hypothetical protein
VSVLLSNATSSEIPLPPPSEPNITISTTGKNKLKKTACGLRKMARDVDLPMAHIALN